ncbi:MAG: SseB family protein [Flavobacteriales bacterium]|nr:SseB family protein [Flavobacteriales bacterium]
MSIWNKLFGKSSEKAEFVPDNSRLIALLDEHGRQPSKELADKVLKELQGPNAYLLVASAESPMDGKGWHTLKEGATLQLASVFDVDGLKVLGAWTDEGSLVKWSKARMPYTSMPSKVLLEMCEEWRIGRVVINTDQPNMFVLQGPGERFDTRAIEKETEVQVGTPSRPLDPRILEKLRSEFADVPVVKEAFHYAQSSADGYALMIGLILEPRSEESRLAALQAIHRALKDERLDQTLDVFVISSDDWHGTLLRIANALFYMRPD